MQGPPGVGKATLVAALAAECGADLIVIGPDQVWNLLQDCFNVTSKSRSV